ncbi:hypothetical protein [Novosphingobium sp. Gsoil 351]|uniref:hypothetical protein n=1 Tax=Novosphingobium sp. Gsoil 351 TaxID=2675225 RepID=UPI00351B8C77
MAQVLPTTQSAGIERMQVDFGLEKDRASRIALWCLLHVLGAEPGLEVGFPDEADREAARNLMDLLSAAGDD